MKLHVRAVGSVTELDPAAWDALDHGPSPFLRHGFLRALEESGSIDPGAPRQPLLRSALQVDPGAPRQPFLRSALQVDPGAPRQPFLRSALQVDPGAPRQSVLRSAGARPRLVATRRTSGWSSIYVLAEHAGRLVGAVPAFVKTHSYGEYIFDWGWASAAQRAGIGYYPKLVIAAPATPATGPRILVACDAGDAAPAIRRALFDAVRGVADDTGCSSIHWLFCTADEQAELAAAGYFPRASLQFHWKNRDYRSFADFLGALKSRKRKQLRKERERARAAIDRLAWVAGPELDPARLDDLDRFYRTTTDQHGGRDYLRPGFFHRVAETLPEATRMVEVTSGGKRVAGALFFETAGALYGRYWGADIHVDLLHFETAYYAGIERAIERGLPLFEAGAQGEHKLLRGFEPCPTYSAHWIRHPGLAAAIEDHTRRETIAVDHELAELAKLGPYREDGDD